MSPIVGILYICTGRYTVFWEGFYQSAEKFLLPDCEKRYYVFTDAEDLYQSENPRVTKVFQENLGWPGNTLYRFRMFLNAREKLSGCDYLYFLNANMLFVREAGEELLPGKEDNYLLGVKHPGYFSAQNSEFTYERNPDSLAAVAAGDGVSYYMGGFNGGRTAEFLKLAETCDHRIALDMEREIIAKWHDESHLNRYFIDHPPKTLDPAYGFPEGAALPFDPIAIIQNKEKFGGHAALRNEVKTCGVSFSGSIGQQLFQFSLYQHLVKSKTAERVLAFVADSNEVFRSIKKQLKIEVELGTSEMSTFTPVSSSLGRTSALEGLEVRDKVFVGEWRTGVSFQTTEGWDDAEATTALESIGSPSVIIHVMKDERIFRSGKRLSQAYLRAAMRQFERLLGNPTFILATDYTPDELKTLPVPLTRLTVLTLGDDLKTFRELLRYENHILANSDTSWWISRLILAKRVHLIRPRSLLGLSPWDSMKDQYLRGMHPILFWNGAVKSLKRLLRVN